MNSLASKPQHHGLFVFPSTSSPNQTGSANRFGFRPTCQGRKSVDMGSLENLLLDGRCSCHMAYAVALKLYRRRKVLVFSCKPSIRTCIICGHWANKLQTTSKRKMPCCPRFHIQMPYREKSKSFSYVLVRKLFMLWEAEWKRAVIGSIIWISEKILLPINFCYLHFL